MFAGLPFRYVAAVGGLLLIAATVAGGAAIWYWLPASYAVFGFLLAGVLPVTFYAFNGAFMFDPTKTSDGFVDEDAPSVGNRILISVLPVCVWAVAYSTLLASWSLPAVRAMIVELAGEDMPLAAERGIRDRDDGVSLTSCRVLTENHGDRSADVLLSQLMEANDELTDCIMAGLRHPTTNARYFLGLRSHKWFEELMTGEVDGDKACKRAHWLRQADALGETQPAMELFVCAVDAPTAAGRTCCADAIRATTQGAGVAAILPPPNVVDAWLPQIPSLINFIARGRDPEIDQDLRGTLSAELQAWGVQAACASFERLERRPRYDVSNDVIAMWTDRQQCALPLMNEKNFQIWNAACSEIFADVHAPAPELSDQLCGRIRQGLTQDAQQEGRLQVLRALRHAHSPTAKNTLLEQLLDYSSVGHKKGGNKVRPAKVIAPSQTGQIDLKSFQGYSGIIEQIGISPSQQKNLHDTLRHLNEAGVGNEPRPARPSFKK